MTGWAELVRAADQRVGDDDVDAARRALDYLCLAQLYLDDNVLLARRLHPVDVAARPAGHWGVCPPVNAALAAIGPYRQHLHGVDVRVVHGAGHAGASALAQAWLTGALADLDDHYRHDISGLRRLVTGFRRGHRFGSEITPLIPGHDHLGGQLGPALAISHGMALDAPDRLVVALIGDGECETGATAAAWLGARALAGTGDHGRVLPVILLNRLRMGSASLLAQLGVEGVRGWFAALGYRAVVTEDPTTPAIRAALRDALTELRPLQDGPSTVVVVTVPKGHGAPRTVAGRPVAGTPVVHKTPLHSPRDDPDEFAALTTWLDSYRPRELLGPRATPADSVRRALGRWPRTHRTQGSALDPPRGCLIATSAVAHASRAPHEGFGAAVGRALAELHDTYGLRVFSPDELASNRILLPGPTASGELPGWVVEVLNEELCHAWAQGYQETGRRAIVISYEAFAPIAASLLAQHLTSRRLAATAGRPPMPSIVYLLTSLGWNNTIDHANPGLVDIALAAGDPTVHVYTPADPARVAAAVTFAVRKPGRCSLIIASKHPMPAHPTDTLDGELRDGYAIWPHLADDSQPELVLLSAGDIPARELSTATQRVRAARPEARLRYLHLHDLTCLGAPGCHHAAIPEPVFAELLPAGVPVLAALPCHPTTVHGLLAERGAADRVTIRGWRPPHRPLTPDQLLRHAGIDARGLADTALSLLDRSTLHASTRTP